MILRFLSTYLALRGYTIVQTEQAVLLKSVMDMDACVVHRTTKVDGVTAAYLVVGIRPPTDQESMSAMGVREGQG